MAFVRRVKPGELLRLPDGSSVRNNGISAVSLVYLNPEETMQETKGLNTNDNKLNNEVKNENCRTKESK